MLYFLFVQYFYFFISNVVGNIISCSYIAGRQAWRPKYIFTKSAVIFRVGLFTQKRFCSLPQHPIFKNNFNLL